MRFNYYLRVINCLVLVLPHLLLAADSVRNDFESELESIVLRKIGHEVLLQSGDSTSRVLPVKHTAANEYQLQFESDFTFQPDSLVKIVRDVVERNRLPSDYLVNVIECSTGQITYSYAILGTKQNDIVPCRGREQPKSCYFINLRFQYPEVTSSGQKYVLLALPLLGLTLFYFVGSVLVKRGKEKERLEDDLNSDDDSVSPVGRYSFSFQRRYLLIDETKTDLTYKEAKILDVFAKTPNQIIDRDVLQKEVWGDEGVIVGRSLDMYISKLRKKLKADSRIELVSIHGKGYKLQII